MVAGILCERKESSVGVLVCGPKKMRHEVANICSSGFAANLQFEYINFSWWFQDSIIVTHNAFSLWSYGWLSFQIVTVNNEEKHASFFWNINTTAPSTSIVCLKNIRVLALWLDYRHWHPCYWNTKRLVDFLRHYITGNKVEQIVFAAKKANIMAKV